MEVLTIAMFFAYVHSGNVRFLLFHLTIEILADFLCFAFKTKLQNLQPPHSFPSL